MCLVSIKQGYSAPGSCPMSHFEQYMASIAQRAHVDRIRADLIDDNRTPGTNRRYDGHMRQIMEFAVQHGGLSKDVFILYLGHMRDIGRVGSTPRNHRAALARHSAVTGEFAWCNDVDINAMISGFEKKHNRALVDSLGNPRIRGSATERMVEDLVDWIEEHGSASARRHALAIRVCYTAQLRVTQLLNLQRGFLQPDIGQGFVLYLDIDKRKLASGPVHTKLLSPRAVPWLRLAESLVDDDEFLFSDISAVSLCRYIKKGAVALRWPTMVKWDGVHAVCRHAGSAKIRSEIEELVLRAISQQSLPVFRHYARTLDTRVHEAS